MPDIYGVLAADIAAELPGYFPGGFTSLTRPSDEQVINEITTADTIIGLLVQDATGTEPLVTDRAAPLAKRYIINSVKAWALRVALAGRRDIDVDAQAKPYELAAGVVREALVLLGAQAVGTGEPSPRVLTSLATSGLPTRDLLITDADLDPSSRGRF